MLNANLKVEKILDIPQEDLDYIVNLYAENNLDELDFVGSGSYGCVRGYKGYAIKEFHDKESARNNDIEVLKDIGHLDCIPNLYAVIDDSLIIVERIDGTTVGDYVESDYENSLGLDGSVLNQFNESLVKVIEAGYNPNDMHERNVMIEYDTLSIKLVDVGYFDKHGSEYDESSYVCNSGYKSAQSWAGNEIRRYISSWA